MDPSIRDTCRSASQLDTKTWAPTDAVHVPLLRLRHDRRNALDRLTLVRRVRSEFREIPGLCLTAAQAARLFGLAEDVCARICDEMVEEGAIQKSGTFYGAFRADFVGVMFATKYEQRSR